MTVHELIKMLEKEDQDAVVSIPVTRKSKNSTIVAVGITGVDLSQYRKNVYLVTTRPICVKSEASK